MNVFTNRYYIQISIFEISFFVIKFRKISPPCQLTVNIHLILLAYFQLCILYSGEWCVKRSVDFLYSK